MTRGYCRGQPVQLEEPDERAGGGPIEEQRQNCHSRGMKNDLVAVLGINLVDTCGVDGALANC